MNLNRFVPTPVRWIVAGTTLLLGTQVLMSQPVTAQTAQDLEQANQDFNDVFSGGEGNGSGSLLNLLNRMQLLNGRSPGEFAAEQNESLNSEFERFRQEQQEKLGAPGTTPAAPAAPQPAPIQ